MIDSTSSTGRAGRTSAVTTDLPKPAATQAQPTRDSVSTDKADQLQSALQDTPEVRPEVVARGKELAADPSYPSAAIIGRVASAIVNSPDLSEDES